MPHSLVLWREELKTWLCTMLVKAWKYWWNTCEGESGAFSSTLKDVLSFLNREMKACLGHFWSSGTINWNINKNDSNEDDQNQFLILQIHVGCFHQADRCLYSSEVRGLKGWQQNNDTWLEDNWGARQSPAGGTSGACTDWTLVEAKLQPWRQNYSPYVSSRDTSPLKSFHECFFTV